MLKLGLDGNSIGTLVDEARNIQMVFGNKNKLYMLSRLVLAGYTWHIWKERNERIFQKNQMSKVAVFRRLYEDILLLMRTCHWKIGSNSNTEAILSNWE